MSSHLYEIRNPSSGFEAEDENVKIKMAAMTAILNGALYLLAGDSTVGWLVHVRHL